MEGAVQVDALREATMRRADGADIFSRVFGRAYYEHCSGQSGCGCAYCVAMRKLDAVKRNAMRSDGFGFGGFAKELGEAAANMQTIKDGVS